MSEKLPDFQIEENDCVGCGICARECPDGIAVVDGIARIINPIASCLAHAASMCPRGIITDKNNLSGLEKRMGQGGGRGMGQGGGRGMGQGGGRGMGRGGGRGMGRGRRN